MSSLEKLRQNAPLRLPKLLQGCPHFIAGEPSSAVRDESQIKTLFPKTYGRPVMKGKAGEAGSTNPLRVGVVFSGGPAAGGHNVIVGLLDGLLKCNRQSTLMGFLDGPSGIVSAKTRELTQGLVAPYRNMGGFDLIGSGRTKIETPEQLEAALKTARSLSLDAIVVIGGDDSNTNAAVLAEYFLKEGCPTSVIGVPKTIDGDLKNPYVATSFGFDTACKIYSELIGNIARDAASAKKYTHFIKLMGRSASHITLECALSSHANVALIGEEVAHKKLTLSQIGNYVAEVITKRAEKGLNYGVVLVPEGLIEFIPEVEGLIAELNKLSTDPSSLKLDQVMNALTPEGRYCFNLLPEDIQKQLLLERDPHGNVQVSLIETEKLLISLVKHSPNITGKFAAQAHFFGYEGRSGYPSSFDAHYCYALGQLAAFLCREKLTGYMSCIGDLHRPVEEWTLAALPITHLMNMEMRKGKSKPVIQKALVDLKGKAFAAFNKERSTWEVQPTCRSPGPIQFFGEPSLVDAIPLSLQLEV